MWPGGRQPAAPPADRGFAAGRDTNRVRLKNAQVRPAHVAVTDGNLIAADAKIGFDDNAEFRHKDIFEKRDHTQEDPREVAGKHFITYCGLLELFLRDLLNIP